MPSYINQTTGNIVKTDTAPGEGMGYVPYQGGADLTPYKTFENKNQGTSGIGQVYQNPNPTPFVTNPPAIIPSNQLAEGMNSADAMAKANLTNQFQKAFDQDTPFLQSMSGMYGNLAQLGSDVTSGGTDTQAPDLQAQYKTQSEEAGIPGMNTSLQGLQSQQTDAQRQLDTIRSQAQQMQQQYQGYIQSIEGQGGFENIVGGRQARLAKDLARNLQPLQMAEQNAINNLNTINQQVQNQQATIQSAKADILQQIQLGQQNFENLQSIEATKYGKKKDQYAIMKDLVDSVQSALEKQQALADKGKIDPLELIKTLIQVPEGVSFKIGETTYTGLKSPTSDTKQISETANEGGRKVSTIITLDNQGNILNKQKIDLGDATGSSEGGFSLSPGERRYDAQGNLIAEGGIKPSDSTGLINDNGEELNSKQQTLFNQIIGKYSASPLIAARDRTIVLNNMVDQIKKDPSNGALQLGLVYSYVQALDTYQSAVREGELSLVNSIDSKYGQLKNNIEKIQNGQIVRPEVAKQIADAAKTLVDTIKTGADNKTQMYNSQARVNGFQTAWQDFISGSQPPISGSQPPTGQNNYKLNPIANNKDGSTKYQALDGTYYNLTQQEYQQFISESGGFNNDLSMSGNGSEKKIAAAIKQVESGGNYNAKGGSGESGAYQFMPATWKGWAKQYLGDSNAPMTPKNQDLAAERKIADLLKQGYGAREIALIWNGGQPVVKKGTNKYGVKYDSGAYANKVLSQLG